MNLIETLKTISIAYTTYSLLIKDRISAFINKYSPKNWLDGHKGDVILIHGANSWWWRLKTLGKKANLLGYRIHILDKLNRNRINIQNAVKILEDKITELDSDNITLIGHSKGGLIAREFINSSPLSLKVKKVITISTPHKGTLLGFIPFFNIREVWTKSEIIRKLNSEIDVKIEIVNIFGKKDNVVLPNKNLLLENAVNIEVSSKGHKKVPSSEETISLVEEYLR